jgi:hypothetical protein
MRRAEDLCSGQMKYVVAEVFLLSIFPIYTYMFGVVLPQPLLNL